MIRLGSMTFASIQDSVPEPGSMVSWHPSPVSLAKAHEAPTSAVPASNMQTDYLHSFRANAAQGREIPGLLITSWDIAGQCDIRAMTYVINAHLRRHDTYRCWFECTDAGQIVRHTISDSTDIEFVPTAHGEMTPAEWRGYILGHPESAAVGLLPLRAYSALGPLHILRVCRSSPQRSPHA